MHKDMIKKPMLASKIKDMNSIKYPVYASPKLDGIRALTINGQLVSRSFLPIPNNYVRDQAIDLPDGLDGELILDNGTKAGAQFNETSSAVMREDGDPDIIYYIFDYVKDGISKSAKDRLADLVDLLIDHNLGDFTRLVEQKLIPNEKELLKYEEKCLIEGYEGVMIRAINSPYKEGRSTEKEGYLLKLKRFEDSEAVVIGFEEKMHNANEAEQDAFGHTKRSSKKEGMVGANTLGKLYVRGIEGEFKDVEFEIGSGFTELDRNHIWGNKGRYMGRVIKYKYQRVGSVDRPRFPIFLGFRDRRDL